jgi:chemotaxis protein methyltransferase CheR
MAILASHLTVGETYFFRDKHAFALLEGEILPALVRARRGSVRCLSLWSAGCATGEEPYSIAIALRNVIPEVRDWDVALLATDINARFLQRASEGVYSQWSFRDTPRWIRERYFTGQSGGRWAILPEIKRMVRFAQLNLLDEGYPSPLTNTAAVDVIFCRNVLMYLASEQAKKVVQNLYRALADGGWLIVSPSETSHMLSAQFLTVGIAGGIFYKKDGERPPPRMGFPPSERGLAARGRLAFMRPRGQSWGTTGCGATAHAISGSPGAVSAGALRRGGGQTRRAVCRRSCQRAGDGALSQSLRQPGSAYGSATVV